MGKDGMAVLQGRGYIAPLVLWLSVVNGYHCFLVSLCSYMSSEATWDAGLNGKLNKVKNNGCSTSGRCLKITEADFLRFFGS